MDAKSSLFIPSTSEIIAEPNAERSSESTYINESHSVIAFEVLQSLREDSCDIQLKADDDTIVFGHKIVLMSASHYFQVMFTNFSECNKDIVYIRDVKSTILKLIVDYFYTRKIVISDKNVQDLLPVADFLQLDCIKGACTKFLEKQLDPFNCIGFRSFSDFYNCLELFSTCDLYIRKKFIDVVKGEEFLSLTTEELIKIISDNVLKASEEKVYESVINWVKHRLNDRCDSLPELMEHVRLPLVSLKYISKNVANEPLFKNLPKSEDYLTEAFKFRKLKEQLTIPQTIRNTPRIKRQKVILLFTSPSINYWYDPTTKEWDDLPDECLDIISLNTFDKSDFIKEHYVVSLSHPSCLSVLILSLESTIIVWVDTLVFRKNFGFILLDHYLYAVGGCGNDGYINSAEVIDMKNREHRMIANMSTKRSNLGVGVLNGLLYAVGGSNNDSMQLKSVECYDPSLDTWTPVAEMSTCRSDVSVGGMDDVLYAIGGKNGDRCLSSVEAYEPSTGVWTSIANMHVARSGSSVFTLDGLLYVVGGYDGKTVMLNNEAEPIPLKTAEIYNPDTDTWSIDDTSGMEDIHSGLIVNKTLITKCLEYNSW
ncbi:ring canal kelch homolog isoform X1 [Metopolophium dirhodum]|uniref:ring canal kelch homolog isoform X1 n=1 Tax=Metopolophium dirhodum TaxID=44670 RepID=UPI00298F9A38|nr:ring canal kelch homolog isoform X1 [Metopolophium dirhodum]